MSAPFDSSPHPTGVPRGFIYFCEERRQYHRGLRAWLFWVPYLAGAIVLESRVLNPHGVAQAWSWLVLLGYLILFPPLGRMLLHRLGFWRR